MQPFQRFVNGRKHEGDLGAQVSLVPDIIHEDITKNSIALAGRPTLVEDELLKYYTAAFSPS
jgi:hypothetical protein